MDWKSPFIVYRLSADGKLEEVFHAQDIKKAKYWLTYIAQPGDVLCRTPAHPKHSGKSKQPEYCQHKENSGAPSSQQNSWVEHAKKNNWGSAFPEKQLADSN